MENTGDMLQGIRKRFFYSSFYKDTKEFFNFGVSQYTLIAWHIRWNSMLVMMTIHIACFTIENVERGRSSNLQKIITEACYYWQLSK